VVARLQKLLRAEGGFGLVELMIAMMIMNIGLIAVMAAFINGTTTTRRASRVATAGTLADSQMELYRALTYSAIALDSTRLAAVDNTYKCESALGTSCPNTVTACSSGSCANGSVPTRTCSTVTNDCDPSRTATGPDSGSYRVDTFITYQTPANGRQFKVVTITVRAVNDFGSAVLARVSSSFDESTG
jgi:type II secretory pathway pseudopilin PulG